jgi:hypothetical protein
VWKKERSIEYGTREREDRKLGNRKERDREHEIDKKEKWIRRKVGHIEQKYKERDKEEGDRLERERKIDENQEKRDRGDREMANRLGIGQRVWRKRDGLNSTEQRKKVKQVCS